MEIADLPDWAQPAFKGMKSLNRVQSKVSDCALYSSENMLVCAPTGERRRCSFVAWAHLWTQAIAWLGLYACNAIMQVLPAVIATPPG